MREWSNGAQLLGRLLLVALIAAPFMYVFHFMFGGTVGAAFGLILVAPLAAKLLAKQLIELGHEGFTWLAQQPLREWEGAYYAFDDVQVRIYEVDDALWFTLPDVLKAIDLRQAPASFLATHRKDLQRVPGTMQQAIAAAALAPLLEPLHTPKAGRFLMWAQREVVAPWERKRGIDRRRF